MKENIKQTNQEPLSLWHSIKIIFWSLKYVVAFPVRVITHLVMTSIVPIICVIAPILMGQVLIDNVLKKNPLNPEKFQSNFLSQGFPLFQKVRQRPFCQLKQLLKAREFFPYRFPFLPGKLFLGSLYRTFLF